jgi:ribosome maturation factor RimP
MSAASAERLRALLAPVVASAGLDLETVEVKQAGRRRQVLVTVDKDGGVSLDDVAAVSRHVSDALDSSDAMGEQPYVLEVSSPGVDRPLTEARHWRRAVGRLVRVDLVAGGRLTARVEAADADGAYLDVDGHDRRVSFEEVARAKVEVEFARRDGDDHADAEG